MPASPLPPKPHAALILVGHGSTLNPDSSSPTHEHADTIRRTGLFAEVACCFWKEEPNMREVFEMVESEVVYVVPNFISEGYFCQEVLPRELRLDGPVTRRGGKTVYYCDPVGTHANMKRLLLQRADEIAPGVPRSQTSLVIVGHGTSLNENSTKAIQDQVRLIREGGHGFADVVDAYMEEAPLVSDWARLTSQPNVVVVPFFISDGLHSYQDIPVLLGILEETGAALSEGGGFGGNPHSLHGRALYYSNAIGTEALLAEVVLDQVADFDARHGIKPRTEAPPPRIIDGRLREMLERGSVQVGEVQIHAGDTGGWVLCHARDSGKLADPGALERWTRPEDARTISRQTVDGRFRPLHSAPTLKQGWRLDLCDAAEVRLALDFFYPAALGVWLGVEAGRVGGTPLREFLGRQTGMYRFANQITDEQAQQMIAVECARGNCLRRIVWPLSADSALGGAAAEKTGARAGYAAGADGSQCVPLLCIESCPLLLGAARKLARQNHEPAGASQEHSA